jgi:hypothetical protein
MATTAPAGSEPVVGSGPAAAPAPALAVAVANLGPGLAAAELGQQALGHRLEGGGRLHLHGQHAALGHSRPSALARPATPSAAGPLWANSSVDGRAPSSGGPARRRAAQAAVKAAASGSAPWSPSARRSITVAPAADRRAAPGDAGHHVAALEPAAQGLGRAGGPLGHDQHRRAGQRRARGAQRPRLEGHRVALDLLADRGARRALRATLGAAFTPRARWRARSAMETSSAKTERVSGSVSGSASCTPETSSTVIRESKPRSAPAGWRASAARADAR